MTEEQHELYTVDDFSEQELRDPENSMVYHVVECGYGICKKCGAAESELTEPCKGWPFKGDIE